LNIIYYDVDDADDDDDNGDAADDKNNISFHLINSLGDFLVFFFV